jgi:hypothetical protein
MDELDIPWFQIASNPENIGLSVREIIDSCVELPDKDIQLPFISAYSLIPTRIWRSKGCQAPLLFCFGQSGSGKSAIGYLLAGVFGSEIVSSASTFASLRNHISNGSGIKGRWLLAWDDVDPDTFKRDAKILTLLKSGWNPKTSVILIAGKEGENIPFDCYCPKVFSSIHPLHADGDLAELRRRMIVIQHKSLPLERDLVDYSSINFEGLPKLIEDKWVDDTVVEKFTTHRRSIAHSWKKYGSNQAAIKLYIDLLAVGLTFEIWKSTDEALQAWVRIVDLQNKSEVKKTPLEKWVEDYAFAKTVSYTDVATMSRTLFFEAKPFTIELNKAASDSFFDEKVSPEKIKGILSRLGFNLTNQGEVPVWKKTE